ncbi:MULTISPECIES: hypothetical protein [unclassified Myroides]|uniref:hypothetical protein n=1 Tax=unclassified Myroides TaxID=2642485 RepID=UPI003100B4FD
MHKQSRRSIRLKEYDYSEEGLYFITICCKDKKSMFGYVCNGAMILNEAGKYAQECWENIPDHFPNVRIDEFIIMPNHIHGILEIMVRANNNSPLQRFENENTVKGTKGTIGSIVRGFKIGVTKWMRLNTNIQDVWQRNYYDHIILTYNSYCSITNYIMCNPEMWHKDRFNNDNND